MKAISIKEPWASLILSGKKTIETRVWKTQHRGKLLICVSASPKSAISGKAVAIVDLVDCRPMTREDESQACLAVYPKAYSWVLSNLQVIKPFKVKGQLRLFELDVEHGQNM